jgi:hypothetical protein
MKQCMECMAQHTASHPWNADVSTLVLTVAALNTRLMSAFPATMVGEVEGTQRSGRQTIAHFTKELQVVFESLFANFLFCYRCLPFYEIFFFGSTAELKRVRFSAAAAGVWVTICAMQS